LDPESRQALDDLTVRISDLLARVAERRDSGQPLSDGTTFADSPRILDKISAATGVGTLFMGKSILPGVYLDGNGMDKRYRFQSVSQDQSGNIELIDIIGPDPQGELYYEGTSVPHYTGVRVGFTLLNSTVKDPLSNYKYEIHGDGTAQYDTNDGHGLTTHRELSGADDMLTAALAFNQIAKTFNEL
jgi:hypothetical protein